MDPRTGGIQALLESPNGTCVQPSGPGAVLSGLLPASWRTGDIDLVLGTFRDPGLEARFRSRVLPAQLREVRLVVGFTVLFYGGLAVINVFQGHFDAVAVRTASILIGLLVMTLPRTPRQLDGALLAALISAPLSMAAVFVFIGTPPVWILVWYVVLAFAECNWGILRTSLHLPVQLTNAFALGGLLLFHGEDPFRTVVVCTLCVLWSVAYGTVQAVRHRRMQAEVWKREVLLATVAHELRTPIATAMMTTAVLRAAPERAEHLVDRLDDAQRYLADLVEALLQFGGIQGTTTLRPTEVDLGALVRALAEELSELHDTPIEAHGEGELTADPVLVRSVLVGLITNALRYARTRIDVVVEPGRGHIDVHVDDDGPGVPAELQSLVFEPLARFGEAADHGGIGMGLAIGRRIAEAHGGRLTVATSPAGGARFTLRLPT